VQFGVHAALLHNPDRGRFTLRIHADRQTA
jgi:hypothetical protein